MITNANLKYPLSYNINIVVPTQYSQTIQQIQNKINWGSKNWVTFTKSIGT